MLSIENCCLRQRDACHETLFVQFFAKIALNRQTSGFIDFQSYFPEKPIRYHKNMMYIRKNSKKPFENGDNPCIISCIVAQTTQT